MDVLIAAGAAGELVVDVVAYPIVTAGGLDLVDNHLERVGRYVDHVRVGGCKLILDGSPQARSAWLSEPYEPEDPGPSGAEHEHGPGECQYGYPALPDAKVVEAFGRAVDSGYQVLAHCNGDAASE